MLYPINTESRLVIDLNGTWKFLITDKEVNPKSPLTDYQSIIVPASYNDQTTDKNIRYHVGDAWYEKEFNISNVISNERMVLRFGSVSHHAVVYINGEEVVTHTGGFTPFEVELNEYLNIGSNRLTVKVNNILDYSTLPVGIYSEEKQADGTVNRENIPNFDFFNYAGINRPVKLYTTPKVYIDDITITYQIDKSDALVNINTLVVGDHNKISIEILNKQRNIVAKGEGLDAEVLIKDYVPWKPLNAYLYTAKIMVTGEDSYDVYEEPFGIRTIEVRDGKFYINNEEFYFKGFGKHEDNYFRGRGLDEVANLSDINLMKWIGSNSFRTAHYPYSEEMMRLADREGIVVIDEVAAVGLYVGFSVSLVPRQSLDNTWTELNTRDAHKQAINELIKRDKNHACVVMWSIANESATHQTGADEYFAEITEYTRELDPQKRPLTAAFIQESSPEEDKISSMLDVLSLNRYYGWYIELGNLDKAKNMLRDELNRWVEKHPGKPIIFTEYGADTVAGMHSVMDRPFTEEYQVSYYRANHDVFDEFDNVVGEQVWNFADFETADTTKRVHGNKKGIFTRAREPKMIAFDLKKRWDSK